MRELVCESSEQRVANGDATHLKGGQERYIIIIKQNALCLDILMRIEMKMHKLFKFLALWLMVSEYDARMDSSLQESYTYTMIIIDLNAIILYR